MPKLLLSLLLSVPLLALAAPMTNDDVIKMVKGGLNDTTVMQAVDSAEPGFDTSPDGLVKLKQGGVSDAVIQRILARKSGTPVASATPAPPPCRECGTITGIREITKPGRASGAGAVAGGLVGALVGNQIGHGTGRTVATVAGAAGGAYAGHMIEKKAKEGRTFEISVRFDDGSGWVFTQDTTTWSVGSRVKLVNGALAPL